MSILNIVLYIMMFYFIFRLFSTSKRNGKGKQLIDIVASINHHDEFFEGINDMIANCGDPVYENKARVIKLWGQSYHKEFESFAATVDELNIDQLITTDKKGNPDIHENEDSFFYIYMGIPNILYGNQAETEQKLLQDKIAPYNDRLSDKLVKVLGDSCNAFYEKKDDQGMGFFQKLLEGDYAGYTYSKSLIGLYKMIANAMMAKYYENEGTLAEHPETDDLLKQFADTGLGKRWLKAIDLTVKNESEDTETFNNDEEEPESTVTEEKEENTEKEEQE